MARKIGRWTTERSVAGKRVDVFLIGSEQVGPRCLAYQDREIAPTIARYEAALSRGEVPAEVYDERRARMLIDALRAAHGEPRETPRRPPVPPTRIGRT